LAHLQGVSDAIEWLFRNMLYIKYSTTQSSSSIDV